jgi:hypothetical protein
MSSQSAESRFACAFLATSYLLGDRTLTLSDALADQDTRRLTLSLASEGRAERARALAVEISRIALALDQGSLR